MILFLYIYIYLSQIYLYHNCLQCKLFWRYIWIWCDFSLVWTVWSLGR